MKSPFSYENYIDKDFALKALGSYKKDKLLTWNLVNNNYGTILNNIKNSYRNRDSLVNIFEILRNFLKCFLSLKSHFVIIYLI